MRPPTAQEIAEISAHETLVAEAGPRAEPCFGFLRIQTEVGARDLLLGASSTIGKDRAILDWRTAPLASVFFEHREGDEFEVETEARVLSGRVEVRALYSFEERSLVEIDRGDRRFRRTGGRWTVIDGRAPLALGTATPRRRRAHSIEIELDADQRRLVESPSDRSLLVLGEAGFGKTTAALHRLAELERRARRDGRSSRSLVIVPTLGLARLSRLLLDRLGVPLAKVATFDEWVLDEARRVFANLPRRDSKNAIAAVIRLKRHPALHEVIGEIARTPASKPRDDLLRLFGDRALMERVVEKASGAIPRHAVGEVLEHTHIQFSRTSEEEFSHVDRDRLETLDGRLIDEGTPLEDAKSIDPEDGAVLFEIHRLRTGSDATKRGRLTKYDAIVIDEAQERAPIELAVLGRARKRDGSMIVCGDEHQHTDDTAHFPGWSECMRALGIEAHESIVLSESHRSPPEITRFARAVVGRGLPASAIRRSKSKRCSMIVARSPSRCHLEARLIDELVERRASDPRVTIAIICRNEASARSRSATLGRALPLELVLDGRFTFRPGIVVTTVAEMKGLEADVAIVPDLDSEHYPPTTASRRALYVAITRARDQAMIATTEPSALEALGAHGLDDLGGSFAARSAAVPQRIPTLPSSAPAR
jgi:ATP-dependent DNA helicase UvrD/PcrA